MKLCIGNAEYAVRHQKTKELSAENNLSILMVTGSTILLYFTGASDLGKMSFLRPAALIIPREGEPILITHDFHLPIDWNGRIRHYLKVGEVPIETLKNAFEGIGSQREKVGV